MKQLYQVVIILIVAALPFLFSFFFGNLTGTAIGLALLGGAMTILMLEQKK